MPPGGLPGEVFWACPSGRRPRGRPRTHWGDYISRLGGNIWNPTRGVGGSGQRKERLDLPSQIQTLISSRKLTNKHPIIRRMITHKQTYLTESCMVLQMCNMALRITGSLVSSNWCLQDASILFSYKHSSEKAPHPFFFS